MATPSLSYNNAANGSCPVPERFLARLVHGLLQNFLDSSFPKVYKYTPMQFWYVYVLLSGKDHMFYIGSTNDLKRRFQQHQRGENTSTAKRLPLELIYFEGHRSKDDAIRREKYFKTTKGKVTLRQVLSSLLKSSFIDIKKHLDESALICAVS